MIRQRPVNKIMGAHVMSVMMERGASKQGTARLANIAPTTFRRSLNGDRGFTIDELWSTSRALKVEPGALFPPMNVLNAEIDRQRTEDAVIWDEADNGEEA